MKTLLNVVYFGISITYVTGLRCYRCIPKGSNSSDSSEECMNSIESFGKLQRCRNTGAACMFTSIDTDGKTVYKRKCVKNMASYAGKCFDHLIVGDRIHSRTCFCDSNRCNASPETLRSEENPDVIYNISSKSSMKCYECLIDANATKKESDIPDCVVNSNNFGNSVTCPSPDHFCMSVHADSPELKYTLRMCSVSSRAPNGTCQNVTIPEVGERKICTCSTNMCNTAVNYHYSSTCMPHILFYLKMIYLSIHSQMMY